jgi:hypothetical protein
MALNSRRHRLLEIDWPEFSVASRPPPTPILELEARIENLRARMEELKITHVVVYGDREHFANWRISPGSTPGSKSRC